MFESERDAGVYTAALVERIVMGEKDPVLGLATGSTPIPLYEALVQLYRSGLDFSRATTINLDEYIGIPGQHEQSYRHFMQTHLFQHVNIQPDRIFIPDGMAEDLDAECARYDKIIRQHAIHMQVLGIGVNGHIGFNEPDDLLVSRTHVVQLRQATVESNARFFPTLDDVPKRAITMGVQAILQAQHIILMAFGEEKANIIQRAIMGEVRTDVPASILQLHRDVVVILDKASASQLDPSVYLAGSQPTSSQLL